MIAARRRRGAGGWGWSALVGLLLALVLPISARDPVFSQIEDITRELSRISGLRMKRKVPHSTITREGVNEYLKARVKELIKPEEMRAEELTLKKFGLVPKDFDLEKTTIELLTEQAAAFYDFNKKRLYITDWTGAELREMALVHELAHALADQNFNLERFIEGARKSDDASLARMAVMEGQASWLMAEYMVRRMGQSLRSSPSMLEMMAKATDGGGALFPVFQNAPLYLRQTLVFPYTRGMLFQHALQDKLGLAGFTKIFARPPVSTQQVLHPEIYFAGQAPVVVPLPELPSRRSFKRLTDGFVGELDHAILLEQYFDRQTADELAPRWRGGRYELWENRAERRLLLAYAVEWDSPETAGRYFDLYLKLLGRKWSKVQVRSESAGRAEGTGDDGPFVVRLEGNRVSSVE